MGLSCGMSLVKYGLFIFNFIILLIGTGLIVIGSLALSKFDVFSSLDGLGSIESFTVSAIFIPVVIIVLGSIVFIISFCGCCGAIRESQCMIMTYAVFLLILAIGVIVGIYLGYTKKDDFIKETQNAYTILFNARNEQLTSKALDNVQKALHCCGKESYRDFLTSGSNLIPSSCCDSGLCSESNSNQGCHRALDELINNSFFIILYVAGGLAIVMFIGLIFSCCLSNGIRLAQRDRRYH